VPAFVQGCTQFIVEYTGDFLAQDTTPGSPTEGFVTGSPVLNGGTGDGVTDFVMAEVPLRPNDKNSPTTRVRRTRWYGMPRNVDTWDDLKKGNGRPLIQGGQGATSPNDLVDVVPLRDVLATYPPIRGRGVVPAFEQSLNDRQTGLAMRPNYADGKPLGRYAAAWGPGELSPTSPLKPTMIRITIVIDDPTGRMSEGQTYEYVFKLP